MADKSGEQRIEASNWARTRLVWGAGSVDIPESMDDDYAHYFHDLRSTAAMYLQAAEVNEADCSRTATPK